MKFQCTSEHCPMHFYEAMQIFAHLFGMPEIVTNAENNALINGDESVEIIPYEKEKYPNESDKNLQKRYLYILLSKIYGYESPWGCMTGVRPTKIYHNLLKVGKTKDEAISHLKDFYLMSNEKITLCAETFENQKMYLEPKENVCSYYLGVPFCPSICSYCTFGSSPIARYRKITDNYTSLLINEFEQTIKHTEKYKIESIYIGGGTPTTLSAEQLDRLLTSIEKYVNINELKEFSVEAGRPDSITKEKLSVLKKHAVSRISINPQTMNNKTLKRIGRAHDKTAIISAYKTAREEGFGNINMDLIAGLPGENFNDFKASIDEVLMLNPECVTVHTLSLKRASELSKNNTEIEYVAANETGLMTSYARSVLSGKGYTPFYMYRQKNCIGNNENVCYARDGKKSPYNIHIMEEDMTIFACGVGAVTKIVDESQNISRFFNMKSVEDYIARYDDELKKKLLFII